MGYTVTLHVYDLTPWNHYLMKIGLGAFHTGVAIDGREYTFGGAQDGMIIGIFSHIPKNVDKVFRTSIELGEIESLSIVDELIDDLEEDYQSTDYDIINRNCNHFSDEF